MTQNLGQYSHDRHRITLDVGAIYQFFPNNFIRAFKIISSHEAIHKLICEEFKGKHNKYIKAQEDILNKMNLGHDSLNFTIDKSKVITIW